VGVILLVGLAYTGVSGAIGQYPGVHTTGQWFQTALQLVFGVFSIFALIVAFRASRWRRAVFAGFIASTTLASALAVTAWGGQGLGPALAAGVGAALITCGVVWLVQPRGPAATTSVPVS
jgi:hypothetical protein